MVLVNKAIVLFVFFADLLQTLGDGRNTLLTFGSHWGDFSNLDDVGWAWFTVPVIGSTSV